MKREIYSLLILVACIMLGNSTTPDDDLIPAKNQADSITRFRVYKNINEYYDSNISQDDTTIVLSIPSDMSLQKLQPEIIVSRGAEVIPASGDVQNFTQSPVIYKVTSEDGLHIREYKVTVKNDLN